MATDADFKAKKLDELLDTIKDMGFDVDNMTYGESADLIKQLCEANMSEYTANLAVVLTNKAAELNEKLRAFDTALINMQSMLKQLPDIVIKISDHEQSIAKVEELQRLDKQGIASAIDFVDRLESLGKCTFVNRPDMNRQVQSKMSTPQMIGLRRVVEAYNAGTT